MLAILVSNLNGLRFEPQTSRSRDERGTARPTDRWQVFNVSTVIYCGYLTALLQTNNPASSGYADGRSRIALMILIKDEN